MRRARGRAGGEKRKINEGCDGSENQEGFVSISALLSARASERRPACFCQKAALLQSCTNILGCTMKSNRITVPALAVPYLGGLGGVWGGSGEMQSAARTMSTRARKAKCRQARTMSTRARKGKVQAGAHHVNTKTDVISANV